MHPQRDGFEPRCVKGPQAFSALTILQRRVEVIGVGKRFACDGLNPSVHKQRAGLVGRLLGEPHGVWDLNNGDRRRQLLPPDAAPEAPTHRPMQCSRIIIISTHWRASVSSSGSGPSAAMATDSALTLASARTGVGSVYASTARSVGYVGKVKIIP